MKLIYHDPLVESEWFTSLLSDVVDEIVYDLDYSVTDGPAIHVVSGNSVPIRGRTAFFEKCRANSDNLTLLHASDKWYSGGYSEYRATSIASSILCEHGLYARRASSRCRWVMQTALPARATSRQRTQRKYLCTFAGEVKASRIQMVEALRGVEPSFIHDTRDGSRLSGED
jgi:hypothetical protein